MKSIVFAQCTHIPLCLLINITTTNTNSTIATASVTTATTGTATTVTVVPSETKIVNLTEFLLSFYFQQNFR